MGDESGGGHTGGHTGGGHIGGGHTGGGHTGGGHTGGGHGHHGHTGGGASGGEFGDISGTVVIHAVGDAGDGHEANSFDVYLNGVLIGTGGPGTTTLTGFDAHEGDVLNVVGHRGTNVEVDAISVDGTALDVGNGVKHGGAQVDAGDDTFTLHNGAVSYTLDDGTSPQPVEYTQPLHLDLTGNEAEVGGLVLGGFHPGDVITDADHTWVANASGAIAITETDLDAMASGGSVAHDFTVTSVQGPVEDVSATLETHDGGSAFTGGTGSDVIAGQGGDDVIYGDHSGTVTAALDITAADADPSETLTYTIGGVPDGCSLSNDHGTLAAGADGTYSLSTGDLAGLKMTMPEGEQPFDLSVTATAQDGTSMAASETTVHLDPPTIVGGGDDILSGGGGNDALMGQDGSDTMLFDFQGHDTADGGAGGGWADTVDLAEAGAGITFTVELDDGRSWTATSDGKGEHHIDLGPDASGHITVAGEDKVDFQNVEEVRW
jgi:hypothetical protein